MPTKRDAAQLLGWEPRPGSPMVRIKDDRWRPRLINAWFLVGDLLVHVNGVGSARDVRIEFPQAQELTDREARSLRESPSWTALRRYESRGHIIPPAEKLKAVDVEELALILHDAATVTYDRDQTGRVVAFAYGGGLPMPAEAVRRDLSGPAGPAKAGPKPKADTARVRELYRETGDVNAVAAHLGISTATVYRHLAAARKEQ